MCAFLYVIVQHHKQWTWAVFWFAFVGWILFNFVVFPSLSYSSAGVELQILDVRLWYNSFDVITLFNAMGAQGRALYRFQVVVADMVYPFFYGILLLSALLLCLHQLKKESYCKRWIIWPLLAFLFDVFENTNTYWMLTKFPNVSDVQVQIGVVFTLLKWISVSMSVGLLLFLLGLLSFRRFTKWLS